MFYIRPPKGLVTLHLLEDITFSRLDYLNKLFNNKENDFNGNFAHLLEDSANDCIGHFILRFLSSLSNELYSFWLKSESLFFQKRLLYIYPRQLYRLFSTIIKHIRKRDNTGNPLDEVLFNVIGFFKQPEIFKHLVENDHSEYCRKYQTSVYFEYLSDLVETRSVDMCKGYATVYCCQWKDLLKSLYESFLSYEMKNQNFSMMKKVLMDPRIKILSHKVHCHLFSQGMTNSKIMASNIDTEALNFPPCMNHLHLELRRKHRLSHYARFYYTLFLKECGMNLEEAMTYWRTEYSKPHECNSLCVHDWQSDAKKFTYSIRHMYGLEGGRKNYKCPNCQAISQDLPGPNYEGGCPFKNFDTKSLKSLLSKSIEKEHLDPFLMDISSNNSPQDACSKFLKIKSGNYSSNVTINKPVQYYMMMVEPN